MSGYNEIKEAVRSLKVPNNIRKREQHKLRRLQFTRFVNRGSIPTSNPEGLSGLARRTACPIRAVHFISHRCLPAA